MAYLEMKNIKKVFKKVIANENVNLSVEKGEVHALLGENGAGKSTLMNILYGMYAPTEGEIFLDGEQLHIAHSRDAISKGIGMVHQHFMLIPTLSVIENVILGLPENKKVLDLKTAAAKFSAMAKEYDMEIDPFAKVSTLSMGEQQRLEILKALYRDAKLLILDEPTAVLTPQEVSALFKVIKKLTANNHTIIFISHKLNEIFEICDSTTVLRQGKVVATMKISEIKDKHHLASLMVGREVDLVTDKPPAQTGETILEIKNLSYRSHKKVKTLDDINLYVNRGEILGICGVDGNGQSELVKCITCYTRKRKKGEIYIKGENCIAASPKKILKMNISHIPEDRQKMGMVGEMNLVDNFMLMTYKEKKNNKWGFINRKKLEAKTQKICEQYNVKMSSIYDTASSLSGGNQQKLVVGREFDRKPDLLIAMHPDRGLDIGSTKYIQEQIVKERNRGAGVILVSSELDEILELSDRIAVMYHGKIIATMPQSEATREKLGILMAGIKC